MDKHANRGPLRQRALSVAIFGAIIALAGCNSSSDNNETPAESASAKCSALAGTSIAASHIGEPSNGARVVSATYKEAQPDRTNSQGTALVMGTPAYCEVLADVLPVDTKAPVITSQINLPTDWNGKKLQFGGGGYNGVLVTGLDGSRSAPAGVALPLTRGYLTAGTDSGHQTQHGVEAQAFALNDEALHNFAYASYKKTHDLAIHIGTQYYGSAPKKSYYMGASEGGREGMMMAQRYPQDYDGIVSIDPVMNWSGLQTFGTYVGGILQSKPEAWLDGKVQLIHDTVVSACDKLDGLEDGVIHNYQACRTVAPAALAALTCTGNADPAACLTPAQQDALTAAHRGYEFGFELANGSRKYVGFGYGGEGLAGNWNSWMTGTVAPTFSKAPNVAGIGNLFNYGNGYVRYFIAQDKDFNPLNYEPNDFKERVLYVSGLMDAYNPDLSAFHQRGGKLIMRENLSDTAQSPYTGLNYWDMVVDKLGRNKVEEFFVAYAAPGLTHVSSGVTAGRANAPAYGIAGQVDLLAQLENWVENGNKPAEQLELVLADPLPPHAVTVSRPLCRYPLYPHFTGSSADAAKQTSGYTCTSAALR